MRKVLDDYATDHPESANLLPGSSIPRRTVLLFPGQGAQVKGMGVEAANNCQAAMALFEEASDVLGYDLLTMCETGDARINETLYCQPAVFVASCAVLAALTDDDPYFLKGKIPAAGPLLL